MKEKAAQIIAERIKQVSQATNLKELTNFEYFAHGSAATMWKLGIFTQEEHTNNYESINLAVKERQAYLKG